MPRLFVALKPPTDVARRLAAMRADVAGARWVPEDDLHVTLKFLGHVAEVDLVVGALANVSGPALDVSLEVRAAYPSPAQARVLVCEGSSDPALSSVQLEVESATANIRRPEGRPFRPHVTLARLKESDVAAVRRWTSTRIVPLSFTAREVILFESRPAGGGYAEVSRWALG
jgi:RNA 2',3'-cyclic 3'-phosphodiesterase